MYDPKVSEQQMLSDLDNLNSRSSEENENALSYYSDPLKACENSHAVAIITEWTSLNHMIGIKYMIAL